MKLSRIVKVFAEFIIRRINRLIGLTGINISDILKSELSHTQNICLIYNNLFNFSTMTQFSEIQAFSLLIISQRKCVSSFIPFLKIIISVPNSLKIKNSRNFANIFAANTVDLAWEKFERKTSSFCTHLDTPSHVGEILYALVSFYTGERILSGTPTSQKRFRFRAERSSEAKSRISRSKRKEIFRSPGGGRENGTTSEFGG